MAIEFNCPHCNATIKAADHSVGKKGACRKCQKELVVPQSREMASPPQNIGGQSSISTPKIEAVRGGDDVRNFQTVTASTEASITLPMPAGWKRRNFQTETAYAEAPPLEAETNLSPPVMQSREPKIKRLTWRVVAAGSAVAFLGTCFWLTVGRGPAGFEGKRAGAERDDNGLKMKLCWCPPGTFTMGSPKDEQGHVDGEDQVEVAHKNGFWIGKFEVTRGQWRAVMKTSPWDGKDHAPDGDDFPVTFVSWNDATEFCRRLTTQEHGVGHLPADWEYQLPTEAQWEYACRAGTTTAWHFGNDEAKLREFAWYHAFRNEGSMESEMFARPVGQKHPNAWGLYDMHGNVDEWCRDRFADRRPNGPVPEWATASDYSRLRVVRGSFWRVEQTRSAFGTARLPQERDEPSGFRVVCAFKRREVERTIDSNTQLPDLADLIEEIEPAVIVLNVTLKNGSGIGSGFVVESGGIAVTNHHVLDGALKATARFADGRECNVAGVLFADPDRDLAIIKLADTVGRPTLKLAKTLPRKGESTIAFGAPKGLTFSATEGIVSAIRTDADSDKDVNPFAGTMIQTSTPISPGNSGGPLLNRRGEVIGVNTFSFVSGQNLNFAVASTEVLNAIERSNGQPLRPLPLSSTTSKVGLASAKGENAPKLSKGVEKLVERLGMEIKKRAERATEIRRDIAAMKKEVREATIQADEVKERAVHSKMQALASDLKALVTKGFDLPEVDFFQPTTGDVGICAGITVQVIQVLSKEQGSCLLMPIWGLRGNGKTLKVGGLDLTSVVDGDRFKIGRNLLFEVVGTHTYPTVSGGTNTVFEVACLVSADDLMKSLMANLERTVSVDVDLSIPALTKEEESLRLAATEKKAREAEAARIAAEEERKQNELKEQVRQAAELKLQERARIVAAELKQKKKGEEAEKKAASKLTLAKTFLKNAKREVARSRLQEIIEEFPDTQAAAEAEKLLEKEKLLR